MSGQSNVNDRRLNEMFDRRATRGSSNGLRESILGETATTRQRRGRLRVLAGGRAVRLLAIAALVAGTVGAGLVVVGSREPDRDPAIAFDDFQPRFEVRPVPGVPTDHPIKGASVLAFSIGAAQLDPRSSDGTVPPGAHGITIASVFNTATLIPCRQLDPSRVTVRGDAAGLLDDLGPIVGFDSVRSRSYDGRAATEVDVGAGSGGCTTVLHVVWDARGLWPGGLPDHMVLGMPSHLIVTEVGRRTVVLEVWAATPEELDAWLPTATQFVDGVHFFDN